jgi:hypothetical protein
VAELLILGRGIAGACAYRAAVELGVDAVVTGGYPVASAAALAVLHDSEVPGRALDAVAIYRRWGLTVIGGARYSSYRKPECRHRAGYWAIDPIQALGVPFHVERDPPCARHVLDCRAVADGGSLTYGATWLHLNPEALSEAGLRIHQLRPYCDLNALAWPTGARIGSSAAKSPMSAHRQAVELLEFAIAHRWVTTPYGWTLLEGCRVRQAKPIERIGDGVVRFGGFHRTGYTMAPTMAHEAVLAALA